MQMQLPVIDDQRLERFMMRIRIVRHDGAGGLRYVKRRSFEIHQCELGDPADGLEWFGELTIYSPLLLSGKEYRVNLAELYAQILSPVDARSQGWIRKNGQLIRAVLIPETFHIDHARSVMIIRLTLFKE